jgi:hypothetical protein
MNDIETLAHASTALANHIAAVIRLSNVLFAILRDGDRDDIDPETRRVILRAAKEEHEAFRAEHFRGIISGVNTVVELTDRMYQAEPASPEGPADPEAAPAPEDPSAQPEPKEAPGAPSPA